MNALQRFLSSFTAAGRATMDIVDAVVPAALAGALAHPEWTADERRVMVEQLVTQTIAAKYPAWASLAPVVVGLVTEAIRKALGNKSGGAA